MASKIKIKIKTEEIKLNLPAISMRLLEFLLNIPIRFNIPVEDLDREELILLKSILKDLRIHMKDFEAFDLVRVETGNTSVLISIL